MSSKNLNEYIAQETIKYLKSSESKFELLTRLLTSNNITWKLKQCYNADDARYKKICKQHYIMVQQDEEGDVCTECERAFCEDCASYCLFHDLCGTCYCNDKVAILKCTICGSTQHSLLQESNNANNFVSVPVCSNCNSYM